MRDPYAPPRELDPGANAEANQDEVGALVPFGGVGGAVASGLTIGPCTRAEAARARLFADGEKPLF